MKREGTRIKREKGVINFTLLPLVCLLLLFSGCGNPIIEKIMAKGQVPAEEAPGEPGEATNTYCTVTFDSNGGSPVAPQTVRKGGAANRPPSPTRPGYYFDDWFLLGDRYSFGTPVTKDLILYARWIEIPPEDLPVQERWSNWVTSSKTTLDYSIDGEGVSAVTVGGIAESNDEINGWNAWKVSVNFAYTARANASYMYVFEAWTESGTRSPIIQYYWDEDTEEYLQFYPVFKEERKTYVYYGKNIPKSGVQQLSFMCANEPGTFYVKVISVEEYIPPENWSAEERWSSWNEPASNNSVTHSVTDNVCTITVSGTAGASDLWNGNAQYKYTAEKDTAYEYTFQAWTSSGSREVTFQYYAEWWSDGPYLSTNIPLTDQPETYTVTGEKVPDGGVRELEFQCADQPGTFFVKILFIRAINGP